MFGIAPDPVQNPTPTAEGGAAQGHAQLPNSTGEGKTAGTSANTEATVPTIMQFAAAKGTQGMSFLQKRHPNASASAKTKARNALESTKKHAATLNSKFAAHQIRAAQWSHSPLAKATGAIASNPVNSHVPTANIQDVTPATANLSARGTGHTDINDDLKTYDNPKIFILHQFLPEIEDEWWEEVTRIWDNNGLTAWEDLHRYTDDTVRQVETELADLFESASRKNLKMHHTYLYRKWMVLNVPMILKNRLLDRNASFPTTKDIHRAVRPSREQYLTELNNRNDPFTARHRAEPLEFPDMVPPSNKTHYSGRYTITLPNTKPTWKSYKLPLGYRQLAMNTSVANRHWNDRMLPNGDGVGQGQGPAMVRGSIPFSQPTANVRNAAAAYVAAQTPLATPSPITSNLNPTVNHPGARTVDPNHWAFTPDPVTSTPVFDPRIITNAAGQWILDGVRSVPARGSDIWQHLWPTPRPAYSVPNKPTASLLPDGAPIPPSE